MSRLIGSCPLHLNLCSRAHHERRSSTAKPSDANSHNNDYRKRPLACNYFGGVPQLRGKCRFAIITEALLERVGKVLAKMEEIVYCSRLVR